MNLVWLLQKGAARRGAVARVALGGLVAIAVAAAAGALGFWHGQSSATRGVVATKTVDQLESMFEQERKVLEAAAQKSDAQLDAFAGRIGIVQAEILRLNALGERLVEMANLDAEEFDFQNPPPVGGPDDLSTIKETSLAELTAETTDLLGLISDRKRKLEQLERMIMEKDLKKHATPSGWPVRSGYITSNFGYRKHPISHSSHFHNGVDFAGKPGAPVLAAADGVVTYSGWKAGYGRLVEIRHLDGLVTRYAHNRKNLVEEGEMVKKGQTIGELGSSGRSTGPHVHFEVLDNGQIVDPLKFVGTKPSRASG